MSNSSYHFLDCLIDEYEEDVRIFKPEKFIMVNYPKAYVMSISSNFEKNIKKRCKNFIDYPKLSIDEYPKIISIINQSTQNPPVDYMYGKFHTYDRRTNCINLDASAFYELFGGQTFKTTVENQFTSELLSRKNEFKAIVDGLLPLIDKGEKYERDYARNDSILDKLQSCTFASAETAFLNLKLRRNQTAHDYINGLSDTFNDICSFYLDAVIYVVALENAIESLTYIEELSASL